MKLFYYDSIIEKHKKRPLKFASGLLFFFHQQIKKCLIRTGFPDPETGF